LNKDNSKSELYIPEYCCVLGSTAVWPGVHYKYFGRMSCIYRNKLSLYQIYPIARELYYKRTPSQNLPLPNTHC